jgi:hypothetical protein
MTEEEQGRQKKRGRLGWALTALLFLLAVLFVPPFLSVSSYTSRITGLMAASLGRPVRLSSVRVRLLPTPGFVLYDLTVEEDPAFGAEPLLHANTVTASIRLLSVWRGRLEISKVSVDEASLNVVRSPEGTWNLDSLFRTSATNAGATYTNGEAHAPPFPYIAATNSRVNFKNGAEKLPFSIVDTDLSFWQEDPGQWRLRLRGQPARTDVSLNLGDTGIVELNATVRRAPELRQMPIQLDMDWRDAQLGQLTQLVTGSDAGWRGDMRGEIHVDGTAASAEIKTRLRATDVHRAEFAPLVPMDFDANCAFIYHYSERSLEKLVCDSPLGNGHIRVAGDWPGKIGSLPQFSVELDRVPVAAGLDALRTVRSTVVPDLEAAGTASGKVSYAETPAGNGAEKEPSKAAPVHGTKAGTAAKGSPAAGPLTGSFTIDGFKLSGGGLSKPIVAPKMVFEPAPVPQGNAPMLAANVAVPLGGTAPLTVSVRMGLKGYQVGMRGQVGIVRGRELAHATGIKQSEVLDSLAGDPLSVDLNAEGPWLPAQEAPFASTPSAAPLPTTRPAKANLPASAKPPVVDPAIPATDSLAGTVTVHNANWKAGYLANHVEISEATLHVNLVGGVGDTRLDPVEFTYGPLKGTASLQVPGHCEAPVPCPTQFQIEFDDLDAATVQTAILGAHEKGTMLSDLINRLRPTAAPVWPQLQGTVRAGSLGLGSVTLKDVTAELHFQPTGIEITSMDVALLGGRLHGTGTLVAGDKPEYALQGDFEKLNPVEVGKMLGENWRGGTFDATGKVALTGYTGDDLAGSAKGSLHFEWRHGVVGGTVPPPLARFDRWTADAAIADGKIALGQNEVAQDGRKHAVNAIVPLTDPPRVTFPAPKQAMEKKH